MPVKTVTLQVTAVTDEANRQIRATGAYFDELRAKNPVELEVKLNRLQAIAESKILAKEMATTVTDTVKLETDRSVFGTGLSGLLRGALLGGGTTAIPASAGLTAAGLPLLASGILGIVPALVAAGAGVAAFGALAIPTFTAVTGAISGVSAANAKFSEAAQNVGIAISTSHADLLLYNDALAKMPANLRSAAQLLGNQSVTWQGLTTSQQDNIIALSQNKSALASLLPAQRTALTQLLDSKAVWDQLSPAQQKVAIGWQNVSTAFQAMATKVAPTVLSIMASGLKAINAVLPSILPLAQAAGTALSGLFTSLDKAVASKGFSDFVKQLTSLSGPAITAIGIGIGQIAVALGKLLLSLASPAAIRDLSVIFETIAGAISALAAFFDWADPRFNNSVRQVTNWGVAIKNAFELARTEIYDNFVLAVVRFFTSTLPTAFDIFKESVRIAFDQVEIAGLKAALAISTAFGHLPGFLGTAFRAASAYIRGQLDAVQADALGAVNNITADWNKLNGLKANLYVYTNFVNVGSPSPVGGIFPTPTGLPPGVVKTKHAAGTASAAPGWAWVGEAGAELVRFQGGETVLSAAQSAQVAGYAGGTGGGRPAQVILQVTGSTPRSEADAFLVSWLNRLIATGHLNLKTAP